MKNYIGSGKKHESYDVVKVTIGWDSASKYVYEKDGKKYLTFDVAAKREADQYGKTHSVSVWTKDDAGQPDKPAPEQPREDVSSNFSDSDIPF